MGPFGRIKPRGLKGVWRGGGEGARAIGRLVGQVFFQAWKPGIRATRNGHGNKAQRALLVPLCWFENSHFVAAPSETNAAAFPKWVEEASPPIARVRLGFLPQGPGKSLRGLPAPGEQTQLKNKIKSGGVGGAQRHRCGELQCGGSSHPAPALALGRGLEREETRAELAWETVISARTES